MDQRILIIEPFYGGSHKKLIDVICTNLPKQSYKLVTMTAKKWHWRARTSSLYIAMHVPQNHTFKVLFCTSVLPLSELLGLRPDLINLKKIVYFHENQLEYPVRVTKTRDFQYGFNEILTCLAADSILFNSCYNRDSFLSHINSHLKLQPDYKVKDLDIVIKSKCKIVYYPLDTKEIDRHISTVMKNCSNILYIVWPHRWEFDKNPQQLYRVLSKLDDHGFKFKVSILGESFSEKPDIFKELQDRFNDSLLHCGYIENSLEYYKVLKISDVVISTAIHEFFGVAMLEGIYCGCVPVVPNRLSYKELYVGKVEEIYSTEEELYEILASLCQRKQDGRPLNNYSMLARAFDANIWFDEFKDILNC